MTEERSSNVREITAKTLLRKQKRIESWFLSRYGMNLYRGCLHDCVYCDGRAAKYRVEGDFGNEVAVKVNAKDVLARELSPKRKRIPMKKAYIMIGGGVGDSYQPPEEKYQLARQALEVIEEHPFPVHVLTKATLVERDFDILSRINEKERAIVSFSFSSADDEISRLVEPRASRPSEKLACMRRAKEQGLHVGVYYLPVIPFITDSAKMIDETMRKVIDAGAEFVIYGGMTLNTTMSP